MGSEIVEIHGRTGRKFAELVAGVRADQWQGETPCTDWDVRALVHHLLYEQRWTPLLFEGLTVAEVGDRFEGDLLGGDASTWAQLLASSIDVAHESVAEPGALERMVHLSFGDVPGEEYTMQLTGDLAIHGWDLARATGQDEAIDPGAVALLLPWAEANAELLAASGMFDRPTDPGPSASDAARLLSLVGRRP
jgi:uncharacterized protein (TIGR03086 family)